jgi:phosphoglycolate phosphatase-like HAD superfamily hydrolase
MERFFGGLGVPEEDVARCVGRWNSAMVEAPAELAPGARRLLEYAHDARVPVIVVSGAQERVIRHDSAILGVEALLSSVHADAHPKREVLRRYAARGPVAFVGDTKYDVAEGRAAGAVTVAVDFGYGCLDELAGADLVVSDLAAVMPLIAGDR